MRVSHLLLLAAATLLASAHAVSHSKISTSRDSVRALIDNAQLTSKRHLRAVATTDQADEERAVPVLGKLTSYLNQKTLDFWLFQGKDPKEVFKILKLNGLKGKAVKLKKWRYRYYVRYLNMWKEARKNTATAA